MGKEKLYTIEEVYEAMSPEMRRLCDKMSAALVGSGVVKQAREHAGLSQKELGKRIGVTQARVAAMERKENRSSMQLDTLMRIAKSCGGELVIEFKPKS